MKETIGSIGLGGLGGLGLVIATNLLKAGLPTGNTVAPVTNVPSRHQSRAATGTKSGSPAAFFALTAPFAVTIHPLLATGDDSMKRRSLALRIGALAKGAVAPFGRNQVEKGHYLRFGGTEADVGAWKKEAHFTRTKVVSTGTTRSPSPSRERPPP